MLLFVTGYDTVKMIKQFPDEDVECNSLSFHGDVVCIGSKGYASKWDVVNDAVVRLREYPGLILQQFCSYWVYIAF